MVSISALAITGIKLLIFFSALLFFSVCTPFGPCNNWLNSLRTIVDNCNSYVLADENVLLLVKRSIFLPVANSYRLGRTSSILSLAHRTHVNSFQSCQCQKTSFKSVSALEVYKLFLLICYFLSTESK